MPNYISMAKRDFKEHGANSMANNVSKASSLKVAESHFKMGTDKTEETINIDHYK